MNRRLFTLALFLLLGAVVNVAVAWGCAIFANPYRNEYVMIDAAYGDHHLLFSQRRCGGAATYLGLRSSKLLEDPPPIGDVLPGWVARYHLYPQILNSLEGRGWPRLSLSAIRYHHHPFPVDTRWGLQTTLRSFSVAGTTVPSILPLRPIWPGFAVNTLFYAVILWLPVRGKFHLRRHLRRKRGLCVACGYDLRHADHEACPECGGER